MLVNFLFLRPELKRSFKNYFTTPSLALFSSLFLLLIPISSSSSYAFSLSLTSSCHAVFFSFCKLSAVDAINHHDGIFVALKKERRQKILFIFCSGEMIFKQQQSPMPRRENSLMLLLCRHFQRATCFWMSEEKQTKSHFWDVTANCKRHFLKKRSRVAADCNTNLNFTQSSTQWANKKDERKRIQKRKKKEKILLLPFYRLSNIFWALFEILKFLSCKTTVR